MSGLQQPSGLEMQILTVMWDQGECTVRQVLESLSDGKARAYTTVLSTIQVMEKKGLLVREGTVSGAIVYKPLVTREQVTRPVLKDLLVNLFKGKPSAVLQQLFENDSVDAEELAAIRRLVDEHSSASGKRSKKGKGQGNS